MKDNLMKKVTTDEFDEFYHDNILDIDRSPELMDDGDVTVVWRFHDRKVACMMIEKWVGKVCTCDRYIRKEII